MSRQSNFPVTGQQVSERGEAGDVIHLDCSEAFDAVSYGIPRSKVGEYGRGDMLELERLSNLVGKPSENHPLHNSGLLSLDPVQDKTPLYSQLLQAYKWSNKLQYHAGLASGLLNQQSLKRSANQMGVSAKRRPKAQPTTLVLPPQYVDDVINRIDRMFPEMSIQLSRPNGTSAMLLVTLGKVLKVIVVMRSLFIDRTIVKGYNENVYTEDGKVGYCISNNIKYYFYL
ncbi:mediator of RNA polymerase II transcription subunit 27, partial [Egretta garzetta]